MMRALLAVLFTLIASSSGAQVVSPGTPRPEYGGGFGRAQYAPALGCVIQAYGTTSPFNSVQCYKPFTNTWVALAQTNAGLPHSRDNELWWYIENTKELMAWGGTNGVDSGRFDLSACAPEPTTDCAVLAYRQNPGDQIDTMQYTAGVPGGSDSGASWNPACDGGVGCGLIFGGNDAAFPKVWIVERNTAAQIKALGGNVEGKYCADGAGGAKLWIVCEFTGAKPPPRNQALGSVVTVGNDFYVGAGSVSSIDHRTDLWKFTRATNSFSLVTATLMGGAAGSYQTNLTYDSDLGVIFFYYGESTSLNWAGWDIALGVWVDFSSLGLPCRFNQYAAYMPNVKKHFFSSGNTCATGGASVAPPGLVTLASPSGVNSGTKLYMAPGLWVYRPFSALPGGIMGKDSQSVKHMSMALNRTNGRVYNFGGDWGVTDKNPLSSPSPSGAGETARNEIWSFDPVANTAVLEHSYCGVTGDITVARPTELGAVWDGTSMWALPGYMGQGDSTSSYASPPNPYPWPCNLSTNALPVNAILKFNVTTKKFSQPSVPTPPCCGGQQLPKNGRYDSGNHSIWRIGMDGSGIHVEQYFITGNNWESYRIVCAVDPHGLGTPQGCGAGNAYINDVDFGFEHFALDPDGRKIYVIDPRHYRIVIISMNTCVNGGGCGARIGARPPNANPNFISCLAYPDNTGANTCPGGKTLTDWTQLNWDSVNRKVLYPFLPTAAPPAGCNQSTGACEDGLAGFPKLLVYDPGLDSWTEDAAALTDVAGARVRGNSFLFDPDRNFFLSYGGCIPDGCGDGSPGMTGYWIYRLGGTAPLQLPPPVTTLQFKQIVKAGCANCDEIVSAPITTTAGSLLVACANIYTSAGAGNVIFSDSKSNTFSNGVGNDARPSPYTRIAQLFTSDIAGGANHTFRLQSSLFGSYMTFYVMEFSGMSGPAQVDKASIATGSGASPSSGATAQRLVADEILVACGGTDDNINNSTWAAGSGFTIPNNGSESNNQRFVSAMEYQIMSAVGTQAGTFTVAPPQLWGAVAVGYKQAGAGGVPTVVRHRIPR